MSLSRVAEVAARTKGRPQPVAVPDGGWTWGYMAELPVGSYLVTLVADEGARGSSDDSMPPGPVVDILVRSSQGWDRQVQSLLATVERQEKMLEAKDKRIAELLAAQQGQSDPTSTLVNILGMVKGMLPAPAATPALPSANGQQ